MSACDGGVEIELALRGVASGALIVIELRPPGMIHAGGKAHVVMARTAGGACRLGQVGGCLCGLDILPMAGFAAAHIRRENDRRPVNSGRTEANSPIWRTSLDPRQARSHVAFVRRDVEIQRVAGV